MKPLTVFLCSTYADLSAEREGVLDAVRRLQLQHDSMEFFGARADLPIETCLAEVRRSDVLVVIVGHRYGSLVPGLGISFSEAEYSEGHRLGKPCLVYLRDENVPVLIKNVERDLDRAKLLEKWKSTLTERHTISTFADAQTLAVQVAADLGRTVQALEEAHNSETREARHPPSKTVSHVQALLDEAVQAGISEDIVASVVRRALTDLMASSGKRRPRVFLSHSHADQGTVGEVARGLKAAGIDIWFDEAELNPGDSLITKVQHGLNSADFVAFFLSKASLGSAWVRQELNIAISRQISADRGGVILPILLDDAEIPSLLKDVMYLDLRDGDVTLGVKKLVSAITRHLIERAHTQSTAINRYFNPPDRITVIGRRLQGKTFLELVSQLRDSEVLLGLYRNQVGALLATHLHSKERMNEMEGLWAPSEGYYALSRREANEGLDNKIPATSDE